MILSIDVANDKKSVALYWPGEIEKILGWSSKKIDPLEKIDQLLKSQKIELSQIKLIVVSRGPGSFTGSRLGVSIANALSFSQKIPIIGFITQNNSNALSLAKKGYQHRDKPKKIIIAPYYAKEPNITKSKLNNTKF